MFRRHVRISREIRLDIYESGEKRARLEYLVRNEIRLFQLLPVFSLILFRQFYFVLFFVVVVVVIVFDFLSTASFGIRLPTNKRLAVFIVLAFH